MKGTVMFGPVHSCNPHYFIISSPCVALLTLIMQERSSCIERKRFNVPELPYMAHCFLFIFKFGVLFIPS